MIRKNDTVVVISGKYKGKKGKVLSVLSQEKRAVVDKLNVVKRHVRPTQKLPQGGIVEKTLPFRLDKLMIFCPKCSKGVRQGVKVQKDGKKIRICKKCGESLV